MLKTLNHITEFPKGPKHLHRHVAVYDAPCPVTPAAQIVVGAVTKSTQGNPSSGQIHCEVAKSGKSYSATR